MAKYNLNVNIDSDIEAVLINSKKNKVIIKNSVEESKTEVGDCQWIDFDAFPKEKTWFYETD